jgi:leader peptidase (prepilin peptidase) / N-methyltransferase
VVCPECGAALGLWGLPVVPWLAVRGRCRSCRAPVGRWALGVEVATGVGSGVAAARFGWSVELPPVLVLVAGLVAVSTVDIVCRRIPTRFVYVTTAAATAAIGLAVLVDGEPASLVGAAVGAVVAAAMLGLSHLLIEVVLGKPFGLGDVRLGTLIGLVAGWLGSLNWIEWGHEHLVDGETDMVLVVLGASGAALLSLIVGTFAGSIVGLVRRFALGRPQPFPLGPWLALGGLAAVLVI